MTENDAPQHIAHFLLPTGSSHLKVAGPSRSPKYPRCPLMILTAPNRIPHSLCMLESDPNPSPAHTHPYHPRCESKSHLFTLVTQITPYRPGLKMPTYNGAKLMHVTSAYLEESNRPGVPRVIVHSKRCFCNHHHPKIYYSACTHHSPSA